MGGRPRMTIGALVLGFGVDREAGRVPNADRFEWRRGAALEARDISWIVEAVAHEERPGFLECDGVGPREPTRDRGKRRAIAEMEPEHGAVLVVCNPEIIAWIDCEADRIVQAVEGELRRRRRTVRYFPNNILKRVADIEIAALVDREANREIESIDLLARSRGTLRINQ